METRRLIKFWAWLASGFGFVSMSPSSSSYSGICIRLSNDDDGGDVYPVITSISCLSFRHLIIKVLPLHFKLKIFFASFAAISYNSGFLLVASVSFIMTQMVMMS
jgi:hypothetical protein